MIPVRYCKETGAVPVFLDETSAVPIFLEGLEEFIDRQEVDRITGRVHIAGSCAIQDYGVALQARLPVGTRRRQKMKKG